MKEFVKMHREGLKITLGVVLLVVFFVGVFFISENIGDRSMDKAPITEEETNPLLEEGQVIDEEKMKEMPSITFAEFKKDLNNKKKTTVIMLGYDACYWCQQQKPIVQMLMHEKNVTIKYLDVSKLSSEENEYLVGLHEDLKGYGTPTFISVKNKKVRKVSPNGKNRTELVKMLVDMGILK